MRISAGVQLDPRDPRASSFFFFFLCVRRFLFSPQLSRIGYKGSHLITNKGNDIDFASHICSNVFFFFSPSSRDLSSNQSCGHPYFKESCSFVYFFNFYAYRSSMHFFGICYLYVSLRFEAIFHFKTQMYRLIIDIIEIFNSLTYSPFQKNRNTITVSNEILILT